MQRRGGCEIGIGSLLDEEVDVEIIPTAVFLFRVLVAGEEQILRINTIGREKYAPAIARDVDIRNRLSRGPGTVPGLANRFPGFILPISVRRVVQVQAIAGRVRI